MTLKFPGERLAHFFCSFGSGISDPVRIIGSTGELINNTAFRFDFAPSLKIRSNGKKELTEFDQLDHFAR